MKRLAVLLVAAFAAAAPAARAGVRISGVDASGYPEMRVTVVAPSRPSVSEDGIAVTGSSTVNLGRTKSVVLAVDRSQSMRGASLRNATDAARAFVAAKGRDDRIEVIGFGRYALGLTKFSSSGVDADAALAGLDADARPGTALWDAIVKAATALRQEDQPGRVIIAVTDGRDVSSTATLDGAVAAAQRAKAAVYVIGITGPDFTAHDVRQLAAQTGGAYLQAHSSAELGALYRRIGDALSHTWQVSYVTAARPGATLALRARVPGVGAAARGLLLEVPHDIEAAPQSPSLLPRSVWRSSLAPLVLAGMVGVLVLASLAFFATARSGHWLTTRIAPHVAPSQRAARSKAPREGHSFRKRIVAATEGAFANVQQFRSLQKLLTRADLPLLAAELLYLSIGVGVLLALISAIAGAPALLTLILLVTGGALPIGWVAFRAQKRMKAFDNQLADLLITIAASLKAGHSFRHAIQAVVDEGVEPAAKEFRRVLTETRLGRPMDDALVEMGERVGSKNLTFVLNAVTIQRQIGGSLAGLFDMVAETVRQRQQFARKVRSLTAMGRMSAYVLGGLPFAMAALISLISPTYMAPLWHTSTGHTMVMIGFAMLAVGGLVLRKIVSFRG